MGAEEVAPNHEVPITREFLEKILKRKVVDFKVSAGSNPGDNFSSFLISLEIVVADAKEPLYLLYKTFPFHPSRQKFLEDVNLFLKEYQVYSIWIPELIEFQKSIIGNDKILMPAFPELVAGAAIDYANESSSNEWKDLDPMLNNFLLMVDIRKTYGFKMTNKLKGLGYQHVKIVMEELAKYHALGHAYKYHHNLPSVLSKFPFMRDPFFCKDSQQESLEPLVKVNMQLVMDACKEFLNKNPEIALSLEKFNDAEVVCKWLSNFSNPEGMDEEKVESLMRKKSNHYVGAPLKEQWIVPAHGDCWTNNILFKSDDDGKPIGTTLVDLQIVREGCITVDLVYFLYTSTDSEFRGKYLDEMLKLYFDKFVQFCDILKTPCFSGFSLDNFKRKFHRSKIFGFVFASLVLPIILQRPETTLNLDDVAAEAGDDGSGTQDWAAMMKNMGRDEDDTILLRERFTNLFMELHEQGIL